MCIYIHKNSIKGCVFSYLKRQLLTIKVIKLNQLLSLNSLLASNSIKVRKTYYMVDSSYIRSTAKNQKIKNDGQCSTGEIVGVDEFSYQT